MYAKNHIKYISKNKSNLTIKLLLGIFTAILSILLTFASLPGNLIGYFLIIFLLATILVPNNDNNSTATHMSIEISTISISLYSGLYMISIHSGNLGLLEGLISLSSISVYIMILIPIYSLFIALSGIIIKSGLTKLIEYIISLKYPNKKESKNKNIRHNNENNSKDLDMSIEET